VHGSEGAGAGGGAARVDGLSGAELAGGLGLVVDGVVAGNGVLDTVESPELQPASAAATTKNTADTVSRSHTSQHGTVQAGGKPAATRAGTRLQTQ